MSLRRKVFFTVVLLFITLFLILFFITQRILNDGYLHLEYESVQQDLERAKAVVSASLNPIESNVVSWGVWDTTYRYMEDLEPDYVAVNLSPTAIGDVGLEFAVIVDEQNSIKVTTVVDIQTMQSKSFPVGFETALLSTTAGILKSDDLSLRSGFLRYEDDGMAVLSIQPILPNNRDKPRQGLMVMGHFVGGVMLREYSNALRQPVTIVPLGNDLPLLSQELMTLLTAAQPTIIQKPNLNYAAIPLLDFNGLPVALFQFTVPHYVVEHGQGVQILFSAAFLVVAIVIAASVLLVIEVWVLHPLKNLLADVHKIQQSSNLKERVSAKRDDELGRLAQDVNHMLDALEQEHERAIEMNGRLVRLKELEELRAREGRFLEHASHEFRTPLTALNTRVYLLKKSPERLPDHVKALERTMEQMTALVEEVFEVARISNYNLPLQVFPICIQDMLRQLKAAREEMPDRGIALGALLEEPVYAEGDPTRLVQSFNKLIFFLQNWSETDKTCTISMEMTDATHVLVRIRSNKLRIEGLNTVDIFKPFAYASESGVSNTGLNVVFAQAIILKHGGSLNLETLGENAEFVVGLPVTVNPQQSLRDKVQF